MGRPGGEFALFTNIHTGRPVSAFSYFAAIHTCRPGGEFALFTAIHTGRPVSAFAYFAASHAGGMEQTARNRELSGKSINIDKFTGFFDKLLKGMRPVNDCNQKSCHMNLSDVHSDPAIK